MRPSVLLLLAACGGASPDAEPDGVLSAAPKSTPTDRDGDGHDRPADCNDADATVFPGATETCDGVDDDCNRIVDDRVADAPLWYRDTDGDGYGARGPGRRSCSAPAGYAAAATDCDDTRAAVNPGATEVCSGLDEDCDLLVDDADPTLVSGVSWYLDADGDGFGDAASVASTCVAPGGYVADGTDCLDSDAAVFPDASGACAPCGAPWVAEGDTCVLDWASDYAALTAGLTGIGTGGSLASLLVVHGDGAFPLFQDADHRAFAAAARHGDGRVVHVGHEGLLYGSSGLRNATFVRNAVSWAGGGGLPTVGVEPGLAAVANWLTLQGYSARTITISELSTVDVYITTSYTDYADDDAILAWIAAGGGYISGGHAWYWAYSNPNPAEDYPGNHVLNETGITITGSYDVASSSVSVPATAPSPLTHAGRALDAIEAHYSGAAPLSDPEIALAAGSVSDAVANLPLTFDAYYDQVLGLLDDVPEVYPTASDPVLVDGEPLDALVVTIHSALANGLPAEEVQAVPSDWPGPVDASAPRGVTTLSLDASYAGRDGNYGYSNAGNPLLRGTGLYAAPGEVVWVTVPAAWVDSGVGVQIGIYTDTLWGLDVWWRHPQIARGYAADAVTFPVASGFGGPLYLTVPGGLALGWGDVTFDGAVAMPRYVHGETDAAAFLAEVASTGAPTVELESARFVLTVPRADLPADLDPASLMDLWDAVLDADADLAAIDHDRVRAERFAIDRQISAGWMHSGYPLMGYSYTSVMADADHLWANGDWGAFHELGHNHQYAPMELPGTTECRVNLWSVYASEQVVGIDRGVAHSAVSDSSREATIDAFIAGGRDFWGAWNTWTCLETYLQYQEAFGWEPLIALNAEYLAMPAGELPTTDQARIDEYVVRSSLAVGMDLTDFYAAWGFPMSGSVYADLAGLPVWTDHPMAGR